MEQLVPKIRFPEFKDKWFEIYLSDLLSFKNGVNASKENYDSGYKFINVLDIIRNNYITYDKIIGSVNITEKEFENFKVEYGDILFQRSSETREEVGQANVYLEKNKPATYGGFVIRGKKKNDYDPLFMNDLLKTSRSRNEITSKSGGSTRYNVGQETLSSVKIYTTTIPEQQKIATFLSSVDRRVELLERQKEQLTLYKNGVMQQLFSQQLRFKDNDGKDFPDWEEKLFNEIIDRISTGLNPRKNFILGKGNNYYVTIKNISNGKLNFSSCEMIDDEALKLIKKRSDLSKDDIIMSSIGNVGESYILENEPLNWNINESVFMIRYKKEVVLPIFLYYILSNDYTKKYFESNMTGSSFKSIKIGDLKIMPVNIPTIAEQKKIAEFLSSIDIQIDHVTKQIEDSTTFKKGLLQQMFV